VASTRRRSAGSPPARGLVLHELASRAASLEEVLIELTSSEVDYSGTAGAKGKQP
jgi:hypothetical protein